MRIAIVACLVCLTVASTAAADPPIVCTAGDVYVAIDQTHMTGNVWSASRQFIATVIFGPSYSTPSGGHVSPLVLQFAAYDSNDKTPKGEKLTSDSVLAVVMAVPGEAQATVTVYPPASKAMTKGTCH